MVLVFLGTQDTPFTRLLKAIDKSIENGKIKGKVIVQKGTTIYESKNFESFSFLSKDEVSVLIDKANLIITHGGVGTITDCIKKGKKVIVVPRLKRYKEHTNDHQVQITKEFAEKGYILPLYNLKDLDEVIEKSKKFKPIKYESNNENFKNMLKEYIEKL